MKEWKIPFGSTEPRKDLIDAGFSPLLASLPRFADGRSPEDIVRFINCGFSSFRDPMKLRGMREAVERIECALSSGEKIAVYGDYDVDGITATCIVTDYLKSRGADCTAYIPNRKTDGYGMNCGMLEKIRNDGVKLIITVDCGITAHDEVDYARTLGMDVIVTDHHECGEGGLPPAAAVIDPKAEPDCGDLFQGLAGVGVALKLICALDGDCESIFERYCDFAAVGTVADVMPLVDENRYIVKRGLEKLSSEPRTGFSALFKAAEIDISALTAGTISFTLAPRLNAAGRLGDAMIAEQLLLEADPAEADRIAKELCSLNQLRQQIETGIWEDARRILKDREIDGPIVLASSEWESGVVGIAASRLAEHYCKPAIIICLKEGVGKGSCRSYGSFNLFDALSACSEHLITFGGHALAAGLNIKEENIDAFRADLRSYYLQQIPVAPTSEAELLITDSSLLSIENVRSLDSLEPYGTKNEKLRLCLYGVRLKDVSNVGQKKQHLRLRAVLNEGTADALELDGIFFSHTSEQLDIKAGDLADIIFTPRINEYNGKVSVQMNVSDLKKHTGVEICREILAGNVESLRTVAGEVPVRDELGTVWKKAVNPFSSVPEDIDEIFMRKPSGLSFEKYCFSLSAFFQSGLLRSDGGSVYGARVDNSRDKYPVEETDIIVKTRCLKEH